jgi:hypothetical protein
MRVLLVVAIIITVIFSSCEKTTLAEDENIPTNVSYETQVLPLFHNCYGCHGTGNTPDLTESNAYRSLIDGGYINIANPKESKIMQKLYGDHKNYLKPDEVKIILGWITEGAKNN